MNELRAYLNSLAPADQDKFAVRCGTSVGYLRKALSTGQVLREKLCTALERESGGHVTRANLRADWRDIWPELAESEPNHPPALASQAPSAINADGQGVAHA